MLLSIPKPQVVFRFTSWKKSTPDPFMKESNYVSIHIWSITRIQSKGLGRTLKHNMVSLISETYNRNWYTLSPIYVQWRSYKEDEPLRKHHNCFYLKKKKQMNNILKFGCISDFMVTRIKILGTHRLPQPSMQ